MTDAPGVASAITEVARVAIVTGGAGGLGRAITARLRADGYLVAVADLDPGLAQEAGDPGPLGVRVDVTDAGSAAAMGTEVFRRWGRIDVLINNAGIAGPTSPVAAYPPDAWQRVIAFTKSVAREVARTGVLVNCSFSTGAAFDLSGGRAVY